jgi:hypothetical protein
VFDDFNVLFSGFYKLHAGFNDSLAGFYAQHADLERVFIRYYPPPAGLYLLPIELMA